MGKTSFPGSCYQLDRARGLFRGRPAPPLRTAEAARLANSRFALFFFFFVFSAVNSLIHGPFFGKSFMSLPLAEFPPPPFSV